MPYAEKIRTAKNAGQLFDIAKAIVRKYLGIDQAGLLVGMSDLGTSMNGFVGAYYSPDANTIILNKRPLARMQQTNPKYYNYYLFHLLLHEYIHSIGSYDEEQTRLVVGEISRRCFGEEHPITQLSANLNAYLQGIEDMPPEDRSIEYVSGIDRKNTNYIN